jgi:hypothetical protein
MGDYKQLYNEMERRYLGKVRELQEAKGKLTEQDLLINLWKDQAEKWKEIAFKHMEG